jgi:SPP1 gp7 family putative phage head morphogenesis protein
MPTPANELLYDASIRHQVKLLRYSAGQARAVAKLLKASDDELVAKLQTELTETSEARLKALLVDIRRQRTALAERLGEEIQKDAAELAGNEAEWEVEAIRAACPVELKLNAVPEATLKTLASRPINGVPLEGWLGTLKAGDVSRIEQAIRLGVSQGETLDQMVKRIRGTRANNYEDGITAITRRNAQTIARTAVNHVSNAARQEVWNANADIISGVRWVATLDGRTSDVCRGRDGQIYPIDSGPRPPAHPGCRSTTTPVLDGEQILGDRPFVRDSRTRAAREVDFRREAKEAAGDKWKGMSQAERTAAIKARRDKWADENIGQVPSAQTYDQWLRKQPGAFQDEVLGKTKAEIFRKGATLDKFVDEQGKPYTIAELKAATSQDKLNVVQPGVGMKAKALLQQGLSTPEVLAHIQAEFPDASTSAASIASYKTELKKAGALDQLVGQLPSGGIKQAQSVAAVVENLEMHLPAGVKHAIGGQWANVVEDLGGMPGAYGYYEAGKGVLLSGKKLSAISQQQAQQVAAHELGHLLHKQHDLKLNHPMDFAELLSAGDKKLYGYYLSHEDELTAEILAQALSPSPLTSQGLSAIEFNKAFQGSVAEAKQLLLDKFPVPHPDAPKPLMGAPSVPYEVAGQHKTVGGLAKALLQQGLPDDGVLAAVKAQFPDAKTTKASLASYKTELKKAGLMPNKASGPTVTVKAVPDVAPVPGVPKAMPAAVPAKSNFDLAMEAYAEGNTGALGLQDALKVHGVEVTTEEAKALKAQVIQALEEASALAAKAAKPAGMPKPALYGTTDEDILYTVDEVKELIAKKQYPEHMSPEQAALALLTEEYTWSKPAAEEIIELAMYQLAQETGLATAPAKTALDHVVELINSGNTDTFSYGTILKEKGFTLSYDQIAELKAQAKALGAKGTKTPVEYTLEVLKAIPAGTKVHVNDFKKALIEAGMPGADGMSTSQLQSLVAEAKALGVKQPPQPAPPKDVPGLKTPKLAGKQLGSVSSQSLAKLKTYFAGGGDVPGAHTMLGNIFGTTYKPDMGMDLIELAQYEVTTGKVVAKPYLAASYTAADLAAAEAAKMASKAAAKADLLKAIGVPARPALTPREGIPPPPRFNNQQRRAAIEHYDRLSESVTKKINAAQKAAGLPEVTVEEASAIHAYTGSTYTVLNKSLRKGDYQTNLALQAYVEAAQHGMAKMPKFVGMTSRGMSISESDLGKVLSVYRVGQVVEEASFISTSAGDKAAFGGNVLIRIIGKRGVDVAPFSKYPGEREVLYMPGTRLKVLSAEVDTYSGKHIITMEEI